MENNMDKEMEAGIIWWFVEIRYELVLISAFPRNLEEWIKGSPSSIKRNPCPFKP